MSPDGRSQEQSSLLLRVSGSVVGLTIAWRSVDSEFVPLWGILVFLAYRMRRVDCQRCGVTVEIVPWGDGKNQLTTTYRWYLAGWAKRLSWSEVGIDLPDLLGERLSGRGTRRRVGSGPPRPERGDGPGDRRGRLATRAYLHDAGLRHQRGDEAAPWRWPNIGPRRACRACLEGLSGRPACQGVRFVCSDMWKPYLKVIRERLGLRGSTCWIGSTSCSSSARRWTRSGAEEAKKLVKDGYEPVLEEVAVVFIEATGEPDGQADGEAEGVVEVQPEDDASLLASARISSGSGSTRAAAWAGKFLDEWMRRVMRSRIEPMKKVARTLRNHQPLILNWFRARGAISSGAVEGLNNKVKLVTRKSYGFRTAKVAKLALLHNLGQLPEPKRTHRFC